METKSRSLKFTDLKDMLQQTRELYGDRPAYVFKTGKSEEFKTITHKEFRDEINALGTTLIKMGLKDKRIAIVGRNRYEWVITHLANVLGGIVSVPLDKELQVDELESCLERSKADVVVFDEKYIENIEEKDTETILKEALKRLI